VNDEKKVSKVIRPLVPMEGELQDPSTMVARKQMSIITCFHHCEMTWPVDSDEHKVSINSVLDMFKISLTDHYAGQPEELQSMCLADCSRIHIVH